MSVVVIGSSNMDVVIQVPHIPAVGETIIGGDAQMIFGGKGANQAVAANRAGADVLYIAKVGADGNGDAMKRHFKNENLPVEGILTSVSKPTGIAQIWVSEKGENSIVVAPGSNMDLSPKDVEGFENEIQQASYVLMQLESPIDTVAYVASLCVSSDTKFILNPAPAQELSADILSNCYFLTPNESEAELLTNVKVVDEITAQKAADVLHEKGVENVIITLGENGCFLSTSTITKLIRSYAVSAVDSTAAGDVFNGALVARLDERSSIEEAISFASAAAAISVTRFGAQPSAPVKKEVEVFLEKMKQ